MTTARQTAKLSISAVQWYVFWAALYSVLVFALPASSDTLHTYHLHPFEYHIILFAITLPSLLVWLAAFIGYVALGKYAYSIRHNPEGVHFAKLAIGCTWLAWSLPVTATVTLVLNAIANKSPGFHATAVITSNYVGLLMALIAYSIIGTAARGLVNQAKLQLELVSARIISFLFVAAGVLYCYLTFRNFDLTSLTSTHNPYFLPIWLMVISVTVPYLYAWFVGTLGAYDITLFSRHIRGVLYRRAMYLLVAGLITVITSSIALQYIASLQPRSGHFVLGYSLIVTALFRIICGIGFISLAYGANRLKKIEEV